MHYSGSEAEALRSAGAKFPAASCRSPAAAIIAALSVESARLGMKTGISLRSAFASASARKP